LSVILYQALPCLAVAITTVSMIGCSLALWKAKPTADVFCRETDVSKPIFLYNLCSCQCNVLLTSSSLLPLRYYGQTEGQRRFSCL